jgi:hypothetical protein
MQRELYEVLTAVTQKLCILKNVSLMIVVLHLDLRKFSLLCYLYQHLANLTSALLFSKSKRSDHSVLYNTFRPKMSYCDVLGGTRH